MAKTKTVDIRLKEANAKFTRALAALDGTAAKDKAYRKAKTELAFARQAYAETRRQGGGQVQLSAVAAKTGTTGKQA